LLLTIAWVALLLGAAVSPMVMPFAALVTLVLIVGILFRANLRTLLLTIALLALVLWAAIYVTPMVVPFAAFVTLVLIFSVMQS
jgi:hypothetical protein